MPEKLEIKVLDGIVRAMVSEVFSLENAKEFINEILYRASKEGVKKILIDARGITSEIPTIARFALGGYME
jgi:anti-anti-sigma regulatory factor